MFAGNNSWIRWQIEISASYPAFLLVKFVSRRKCHGKELPITMTRADIRLHGAAFRKFYGDLLAGIFSTDANVIAAAADYLLPFALPMLLFQTDIRKICRESGQLLIAFLIGAAGTVVGAFVSGMMFQSTICEMPGLAAMMTGTYIGGSVNFAVLGSAFHVSEDMVSAATIADNLNMAVYFFVLLSIPVKASAEDTQKVQDQGK